MGQAHAPSIQERGPPPFIVVLGQLEIGHGDTHTRDNYQQQGESEEHHHVGGVHVVTPHRNVQVVQFHVDGRKGEEPRNHHLHGAFHPPMMDDGPSTPH